MKKHFKQAAATVLSSAVLLTGSLAAMPAHVSAASDCIIDTTTTYQTIRGFGGINHPEWTGQDMTQAQLATAFGNGDGQLGLTVLRVFVNPDSSKWNLALPAAQYATKNNVTVFASPWEPPASLAESGGSNGKLHLPASNYEAYAKHLNDFGNYMKNNGVDLYSISVQNEPDYAKEWTYWSPTETTNFIANFGDKITSTRLMSAETFQYGAWSAEGRNYYNNVLNNAKAMANVDLFGTHFYGTPRNKMDFPELENSGKEIWMTEVYVPNSESESANRFPEAIQVAENIHNGLVVGNMSAYTWWYIRRTYGLMTENGAISKRGAMMAQYSKYIRPGAVRIAATELPEGKNFVAMDTSKNNYDQLQTMVSAYKLDNQITVVAINPTPTPKTQGFTISSGEKISGIEAYRTSGTENFAASAAPSYSDSSFSANLAAQSVTTFVISTGEAEPDPDGYLFHYTFEKSSEGFTGRGGASAATVSSGAYAGSQALSVTGREATWHGAIHTLSSSVFKAGESYSFSAVVKQNANASEPMHFSVEYKDASGETHYDKIASGLAPKGEWVQLANTSYTIPAGATNVQFYFETDGDTGTTCDFLVDEVIGAPAGTQIDGPKAADLPDNPAVDPPSGDIKLGDVNADGIITAADLSLAKAGALTSFASNDQKKAADVNQDGTVDHSDLDWFVQYLTGQTKTLPDALIVIDDPITSTKIRTITEYTAAVKDSIVMTETSDSKTKKGGVTYPEIKKEYYFSKKANKNKPYNIMLPANYNPSKKYPVLYLLHGFFEDEDRMILTGNEKPIPTPQIITNAIAEGAAKEMIVVVPLVFTHPTKDGATGFQDYESCVGYDNFVDDIVDSLMPHIESKYSVATGRENTAVTGFSMGGRESLRIGMKYPDKFGYVGAICPAPGVEGPWSWSEDAAPSLVLLTGGTNDDVVGLSTPEGYHNNFNSAGTPHIWHVVQGGYHGDNCIRAHIYNFVRVIFKA